MSADSIHSTYREKLLEHLFIGELLKDSWTTGRYIEVSRPEADRSGYDVILERGNVIRHIQLKTRTLKGQTQTQKVHVGLSQKSSGCVIVILFDEKLTLGPFFYFGSEPTKPLPSLDGFPVATHTKPNKNGMKTQRPNLRVVKHSKFQKFESLTALSNALFGQ